MYCFESSCVFFLSFTKGHNYKDVFKMDELGEYSAAPEGDTQGVKGILFLSPSIWIPPSGASTALDHRTYFLVVPFLKISTYF